MKKSAAHGLEGGEMTDGRHAFASTLLPRLFIIASFACLLGGCFDMMRPAPESTAAVQPRNPMRRPGISPAGASVALVAVAGAPQFLTDQFSATFAREARQHELTIADADKANYVVRAYLNASPRGSGTTIAFVLDIFDANRQRAQRIEDEVIVKAAAGDPWSSVDQTVLNAVAAKSAEDLANFMTNTPEAIAASQGRPVSGRQIADVGQTTFPASTPQAAPETPPPPPHNAWFAWLH